MLISGVVTVKTDACTDSSSIPLKGECINNINKLRDYMYIIVIVISQFLL